MTCCATTRTGEQCKRHIKTGETHCHLHKPRECSVCLSSLDDSKMTLPCKHTFHKNCIEQWKNRGNNTCPYCRAEFCEKHPGYKITLIIENLKTHASNTYTPTTLPDFVRELISPFANYTEIIIDVENDESLTGLLNDFGL